MYVVVVSEPGSGFNSKSLGLRAQKKLLSKMAASKGVAKVFIDDVTGRVLDHLYHLCKEYSSEKKEAEKVIKNIIKMVVKVAILYRNDQLDSSELAIAEQFKKKFRAAIMTVNSFYEVDFTFDKIFLSKSLLECRALLHQLIERHLTDKSKGRVEHVFNFFSDPAFLEAVFAPGSSYRPTLGKMVTDLDTLMEDGVI